MKGLFKVTPALGTELHYPIPSFLPFSFFLRFPPPSLPPSLLSSINYIMYLHLAS